MGNSSSRFALNGRRALITGSSQGIGLELARGLAEAGASVILNGRDPAKLESAADGLRRHGHAVETAVFDVTDEQAVKAAVALLTGEGRAVGILVNNAGIQIRAPLLETSVSNWQRIVDTNLTAAFLMARTVVPGMIGAQGGKIVNICSIASDLARATTGPYTAAKGGLRMLTRTMCVEWAHQNIQINSLAPGFIISDMTEGVRKDPRFDSWVCSRTPAGRWGHVEDLMGACVFLCSPAADFVNGQMLVVDGGLSVAL